MPLKPHAGRSDKVHPPLATVACTVIALWLGGCAAESLDPTPPQGVDLSGEWKINWNLSDAPPSLNDDKNGQPSHPAEPVDDTGRGNPGSYGRPGISRPGGIDPNGNNLTRTDTRRTLSASAGEALADSSGGNPAPGLLPVAYTRSDAPPSTSSDSTRASEPAEVSPPAPGDALAHMLDAPERLTISQSGLKFIVRANGTASEYTAGEKTTVPFGLSEAARTSGWSGTIFTVAYKAKKGPSKEDDFALDSEGHLIFTTVLSHTRKGNVDFKRVYDRVTRGD